MPQTKTELINYTKKKIKINQINKWLVIIISIALLIICNLFDLSTHRIAYNTKLFLLLNVLVGINIIQINAMLFQHSVISSEYTYNLSKRCKDKTMTTILAIIKNYQNSKKHYKLKIDSELILDEQNVKWINPKNNLTYVEWLLISKNWLIIIAILLIFNFITQFMIAGNMKNQTQLIFAYAIISLNILNTLRYQIKYRNI